MAAIDWPRRRYAVGNEEIDEMHAEFVALINAISMANDDCDIQFLLRRLVEHTEKHFEREEQLMESCDLPGKADHKRELARVLGELCRFEQMAARGMSEMAKVFVIDLLPRWFDAHLSVMVSDLACRLKAKAGRAGRKPH